jgi:hypothetical protein
VKAINSAVQKFTLSVAWCPRRRLYASLSAIAQSSTMGGKDGPDDQA